MSDERKYYEASKDMGEKIERILKDGNKDNKVKGLFAKKYGASRWWEEDAEMVGLFFDKDPGTAWKRVAKDGYYRPLKKTPEGKVIAKAMGRLPTFDARVEILKLLGAGRYTWVTILSTSHPGAEKLGGKWVISIPSIRSGWVAPESLTPIPTSEYYQMKENEKT